MLICLDQRTGTGCGTENRDGANHCAGCGRSLRFAMQLQNVGARVGMYRIARLIGHGGFGAVYEAEDTRTGQRVALKESFDADSIRSFQREFTMLKNLQHGNLPRYFEMFEDQGNGYLVMEYVPGQSLEEALRANGGQPLLESQVIGYALQVCDALAYLHAQTPPIFHRDIKPANIRITPAGLIKLVDFGLVKQGTGITGSSQRAVTPAYAPLEQYGRIAGAHTDARSDIYALGATLYHLLTAREPVPSIERVAVHPDPLPAPQTLNVRLSHNVATALATAMGMRQVDRFTDANALRYALVGTTPLAPRAAPPAQTPPPIQAPRVSTYVSPQPAPTLAPPQAPRPTPSRQTPPTSDFPWVWVLGLGALVVTVVIIILLLWVRPPPPAPTARPVTVITPILPPTITRAPSPTEGIIVGQTERHGKDNAEMVLVQAGEFTMGSTDQQVAEAKQEFKKLCDTCNLDFLDAEKPQHIVFLDSYWIDQYEVTNGLYKKCVDDSACQRPAENKSFTRDSYFGNSNFDNFPVLYVSWDDARNYCAWAEKRLPTEAEWEKAARGTDGRIFPWGNEFEQSRVNNDNVVGDTTEVGKYPKGASPYGAMDMAGNVWEWVNDWYDSNYSNNTPRANPQGPASGGSRVLRGGSWNDYATFVRAAGRINNSPSNHNYNVGLRCAQ